MAQQTAVEFLLGELKKYTNPVWTGDEFIIKIPKSDMVTLIQQTKQMETIQIEKAYNEGVLSELEWRDAKQYYAQEYGEKDNNNNIQ